MNVQKVLYTIAGILAVLAVGTAHIAQIQQRAMPAAVEASAENGILPATTTPDVYPVARVVDGDTIDVLKDGATVRVRIIGMDTPEIVDPRKPVQCFARAASDEGHKILDHQYVRLEYDPSQDVHDKYGRTLAYVFLLDGTSYEQSMIGNGFAHEYTYKLPYKYQKEFRAAQTQAQSEKRGLWSPSTCDGNTTQPAKAGA